MVDNDAKRVLAVQCSTDRALRSAQKSFDKIGVCVLLIGLALGGTLSWVGLS